MCIYNELPGLITVGSGSSVDHSPHPRGSGISLISRCYSVVSATCDWCLTHYLIICLSQPYSLGYEVCFRMLIKDYGILEASLSWWLSVVSEDQEYLLLVELFKISLQKSRRKTVCADIYRFFKTKSNVNIRTSVPISLTG